MRLPFSLRLALPSIHLSTFVENVFSYLFMYFFSTLKDVVLASLFQNPTKHISDQTSHFYQSAAEIWGVGWALNPVISHF